MQLMIQKAEKAFIAWLRRYLTGRVILSGHWQSPHRQSSCQSAILSGVRILPLKLPPL